LTSGPLALFERTLAFLNRWIVRAGSVALLAAALILTYSVVSRYFFKAATDWEDEAAVFCIVGAVFTAAAYVQSVRGHVGIELLATFLPPAANRIRAIVVDIASCAFCAFFAWKSWTLWHEAYVDHQTTTSAWAPPLWIPYALMAVGMTLLALQIALQVAEGVQRRKTA
jgi:TRAP-type C4-dicarboxylate transport system permease small subunit